MSITERFEKVYLEAGTAPWTFPEPHSALVELVQKLPIGKVLEVGCGEGHHAIYLAERKHDVTAIDRSARAIEHARVNANKKETKVEFRNTAYQDFAFQPNSFDFIFDWRFFHELAHLREREDYLSFVRSALAPTGKYLSVAFSSATSHWGTGTARTSPVGIELYFAPFEGLGIVFAPFNVIEKKLIELPQKGQAPLLANYVLLQK